MSALLAAVRDNEIEGILVLLLVIAAVLAILGGLYKAWLRDFPAAAVLIVLGLIVLVVAT
jgi:hypothetical protein